MSKELTPLEALRRLRDYEHLPSRNPVAYLLEQDNLAIYYNIIENALKALEIIKEKCEFIFIKKEITGEPTRYEIRIMSDKEKTFFTTLAIFAKDQEEYDVLKEVLL